jgi:hypothetical protein
MRSFEPEFQIVALRDYRVAPPRSSSEGAECHTRLKKIFFAHKTVINKNVFTEKNLDDRFWRRAFRRDWIDRPDPEAATPTLPNPAASAGAAFARRTRDRWRGTKTCDGIRLAAADGPT